MLRIVLAAAASTRAVPSFLALWTGISGDRLASRDGGSPWETFRCCLPHRPWHGDLVAQLVVICDLGTATGFNVSFDSLILLIIHL